MAGISSTINTVITAADATFTRLPPLKATTSATIKPARAEYIPAVALKMAGKVITESVT